MTNGGLCWPDESQIREELDDDPVQNKPVAMCSFLAEPHGARCNVRALELKMLCPGGFKL